MSVCVVFMCIYTCIYLCIKVNLRCYSIGTRTLLFEIGSLIVLELAE